MNRSGAALSLPLAASIAGHIVVVALMIAFVGRVAPLVLPPAPKPPIEIMLAVPPPVPEPPPAPQPTIAETPPLPQPPVVKPDPPAPVVKAEPPPPPPAHPRSKPVVTRPPPRETPAPRETYVAPPPPVQTAAIPPVPAPAPPPAAPPGPLVSSGYRAALGAWLESHKRYPDAARDRGEAGQAVLRFHVERSGRVLNYAVVKSTGYPELDAAIDQMMRGASLPPFPADMTANDVEVSVTIRFALAR